jgi:hypothetical protein
MIPNIFWSLCLDFFLPLAGSVYADIVVGRLPVTLANQYFSLDGVRCRQICAYTRHAIPTQALRFQVAGTSQGTYGSRVHNRLLQSHAFSDLPFFLLEVIICISILPQFMTKTKPNSIEHSAGEDSHHISSVLWIRWTRTCYWTLSGEMRAVHCLIPYFFMIHDSWHPSNYVLISQVVPFTLLTKILHVISHLSHVCCCMLCLCLPHGSFLYVFRQKLFASFLISLTCTACSIHLALLDLMP